MSDHNGGILYVRQPSSAPSEDAVNISPPRSVKANIDPDPTQQSRSAPASPNHHNFSPSHRDNFQPSSLAQIQDAFSNEEHPSLRVPERGTHLDARNIQNTLPSVSPVDTGALNPPLDTLPAIPNTFHQGPAVEQTNPTSESTVAAPQPIKRTPRTRVRPVIEPSDRVLRHKPSVFSTSVTLPASSSVAVQPTNLTGQLAPTTAQPASHTTESLTSFTLPTNPSAIVQSTNSIDQPSLTTAQPAATTAQSTSSTTGVRKTRVPKTRVQPAVTNAQSASSTTGVRNTRVQPVIETSDRVLRHNPKRTQKISEMAPARKAPASKPATKRKAATNEGPPAKKARTATTTSSAADPVPSTQKAVNKTSASTTTKARKATAPRATKARATTKASSSKAAPATKASSSRPVANDTQASSSDAEHAQGSDNDSANSGAPSSGGTASKRKAETTEGPPAKRARVTGSTTTNKKGKAPARSTAAINKQGKAPVKSTATTRGKASSSKATEAVPAKTAATKASTKSAGKKRARTNDDDNNDKEDTPPPPPPKKARKATSARAPKPKVVINHAPTQKLDVFVCGEGSGGELGLGNGPLVLNVKRPRLNPNLSAREVGVVHLACGGMHAAALTHDNQILTWGVNDHGALGRDTTWDATAENEAESEDESTAGLNPRECTPSAIPRESFPPDTVFTQLACGDSTTFALTDDGDVYGWGTFRCNDGILGFSKDVKVQATPVKLPKLKKITQLACGSNHTVALKQNGEVYIWGSGEQNQLGHRVVERKRLDALTPTQLRLTKRCRLIGCGQDHSFAVQSNEDVWAWGLNSFGETGIREGAGGDGAIISYPVTVPSLALQNDTITSITGGSHHSAATTANGVALVWGRTDGQQTGLDVAQLPEADLIRDQAGNARILIRPTALPSATVGTVNLVAVGTDHSICVNTNGEAWSWGFNANYQCGQGTDSDIAAPTQVANSAVRNRTLSWAGAGGQFSVLAAVAEV